VIGGHLIGFDQGNVATVDKCLGHKIGFVMVSSIGVVARSARALKIMPIELIIGDKMVT
jgi:hypothetical protein